MSARGLPPQLAQLLAGLQSQQAPNGAQPDPDELIDQILGGEIPGTGYLFPSDPEKRRQQLIQTTPDFVRANILRAIEVVAFSASLPYGADKKETLGKAALAFSQAYLLLDPSVDENGIPVEGEGSIAHAQAKAQQQFPPRVPLPAAAQKIAKKNEGKSQALKHDRGQRPLPKPRVGA